MSDPAMAEILCPKCFHDHNTVVRVYTRLGSGDGAVIYGGTEPMGVSVSPESCLVIEFKGVCGHDFIWELYQDRGRTCANAELI